MILDLLSITLAAVALSQLQDLKRQTNARLTALERREPEKRVNPVMAQPITGATLYPPIENFTPKKPETLRPNQVRGREVEEREFEFDVKI